MELFLIRREVGVARRDEGERASNGKAFSGQPSKHGLAGSCISLAEGEFLGSVLQGTRPEVEAFSPVRCQAARFMAGALRRRGQLPANDGPLFDLKPFFLPSAIDQICIALSDTRTHKSCFRSVTRGHQRNTLPATMIYSPESA